MYTYNYSKLRGRITEKLGTLGNFIIEMNMSEPAIYNKFNNRTEFKQSEILKACEILNIPIAQISEYFFTYNS